jgi:hypothetical protein
VTDRDAQLDAMLDVLEQAGLVESDVNDEGKDVRSAVVGRFRPLYTSSCWAVEASSFSSSSVYGTFRIAADEPRRYAGVDLSILTR